MSETTETLDPDIVAQVPEYPEVVDLDQSGDAQLAAWLAAEQAYHAEVTAWLAAEASHSPGGADYDWAPHYGTTDLYVHTYPDGQVVALRQFKDIYSKQWLRSIRDLATDFDVESAAVDRAACETARELIDNRPAPIGGPDDFDALFKAWSGGVTPGE